MAGLVACGIRQHRWFRLPLLLLLLGSLGCPKDRDHGGSGARPRDDRTGQAPSSGPLAQKLHYEQGKRLLRQSKPAAAAAAFERAVKADPRGPLAASANLGLGSARGELGQHQKAVAAYQKVVELLPSDPEGYRALAIGLEDAGRLKQARDALLQAVALDPDQLSAYQDLASLALKSKNIPQAKEAYLQYELTRTRLIRTLGLAKSDQRREEAAVALGQARDEATAKALGLALADRSRRVRVAVIRALGQQGLAQGSGPLRALLARTKDAEERRLIQLSLQSIQRAPQPGPQPVPAPQPASAPSGTGEGSTNNKSGGAGQGKSEN